MLICPTIFLKVKSVNSKNSINSFSHAQLQYKLCGLINDCYDVTLPSHSHTEVGIVITRAIKSQ